MADRTTVSGTQGLISMGAYSTHCYSWSLDIEMDTPEDTNWCDWQTWPSYEGWRTYLAGLKGWSGSAETYADESPSSGLIPGGPFTAKLYVIYDSSAGVYTGYSGSVLVSGVSPEQSVDGVASLSVDFQGTGPVTIGDIGSATSTS